VIKNLRKQTKKQNKTKSITSLDESRKVKEVSFIDALTSTASTAQRGSVRPLWFSALIISFPSHAALVALKFHDLVQL